MREYRAGDPIDGFPFATASEDYLVVHQNDWLRLTMRERRQRLVDFFDLDDECIFLQAQLTNHFDAATCTTYYARRVEGSSEQDLMNTILPRQPRW